MRRRSIHRLMLRKPVQAWAFLDHVFMLACESTITTADCSDSAKTALNDANLDSPAHGVAGDGRGTRRIVLIVDSDEVLSRCAELDRDGRLNAAGYAIGLLVRNASSGTATAPAIVARVERMILQRARHNPVPAAAPAEAPAWPTVTLEPQATATGFDFGPDDRSRIAAAACEVTVVLTLAKPAPALLPRLPGMVIGIDWGLGGSAGAGPAGFQEVVRRDPATGFRFWETSAGVRRELAIGAFPTLAACGLNARNLIAAAVGMLPTALGRAGAGAGAGGQILPRSAAVAREPSSGEVARALWRTLGWGWAALAARLDIARREIWQVALIRGPVQRIGQAPITRLENPPECFLADPFVVEHEGRHYCFAEEYDFRLRRGRISVFDVDAPTPVRLGVALDEPFHLSFPYVFRVDGRLYMCPETLGAEQVRIYECTDFPLGWRLHHVAIDAISAADTMIVERDGRWWMLTSLATPGARDHSTELAAFVADHPLHGAWSPHRGNPIVVEPVGARNGGLIRLGKQVFRVAQRREFNRYGAGASVRRITRLDDEGYAEHDMLPLSRDVARGAIGLHHVSGDANVTVFDLLFLETWGQWLRRMVSRAIRGGAR